MRTKFTEEIRENEIPDTVSTHQTSQISEGDLTKWPKKVKHRNKVLAKIYQPCQGRDSYRVTWYAAGKRQMKSLPTYAGNGGAKEFGDALVTELAKQSQAIMLTPAQATDALAAIERLNAFRQSTGRKVSLLAAVAEYCEAVARLPGHTLAEAATGFLRTAVTVTRQDLTAAVEEFIVGEEPRTKGSNGQRAQLSAKYHYNRAIQLRRFAAAFSGYTVCALGKHDLDRFMSAKTMAAFSAKNRNHHRNAVAQFLDWCVRKDYLAVGHRLREADGMRPEHANTASVQCYTSKELRTLLEAANGPLRAIIAIGGLAGLRTAELLRLDWADVWRAKGHVEVTAVKSKTRARRLVEFCPALDSWLQPFRQCKTGLLWQNTENVFVNACQGLWEKAGVTRKANGLRHSFCSYHFAKNANENLTAQQAGNSPAMIHAHYKGLATKKEAEAWFAIKPAKAVGKIINLPLSGY